MTSWQVVLSSMMLLSCSLPAAEDPIDAEFAKLRVQANEAFKKDVAPFVRTYCIECHGNRRTRGGLNLEPALKAPGESSAGRKWIQSFANVHALDMPPSHSEQPLDEEREKFLAALGKLKYLSAKDPGPFVIRRLTKMEYTHTLQDLLGVPIHEASELPDEVPGQGYLNSMSPMQTEQYLDITNAILERLWSDSAAPSKAIQSRWISKAIPEGDAELPTVRELLQNFARHAFRRPVATEELATLEAIYHLGRKKQLDPLGALRLSFKAVLVSPQFLFITPAEEVTTEKSIVPIDDFQLASRLSYLLWASMPDETLFQLAESKQLHEPEVLKAQVGRMLKDPKSRALFDGFGAQWLGLQKLSEKTFDEKKFPQMTPALREAMYEEARLFFQSLIQENRSVVAFVDSDYTFMNQTLAKVYGLEGEVKGEEMRRVSLSNKNRGGILGMPGILATTSFPNRTSAVNRGVWVLEQVLGEEVPPAPANVPALEKQSQKDIANLTLRQRTELHRTEETCANCHKILDPIGFGLENFDAIGFWRDKDDAGGVIDAAGELPGGKTFSTPQQLKAIIASREEDLARNFIEKMLAYALCRQLEGYDRILVDQMIQRLEKDKFKLQNILSEIVTSYPFLNRRIKD